MSSSNRRESRELVGVEIIEMIKGGASPKRIVLMVAMFLVGSLVTGGIYGPPVYGQERVVRQVVSSGATTTSDGLHRVWATIGQPIVGVTVDPGGSLYQGFWGPLDPAPSSVTLQNEGRTGELRVIGDRITIGASVRGPIRLVVIDLFGQTVRMLYEGDAASFIGSSLQGSDGGSLPSGSYFLVLSGSKKKIVRRLNHIR